MGDRNFYIQYILFAFYGNWSIWKVLDVECSESIVIQTSPGAVTMSIEPRAELPSDMKDNYHFGEM